MGHGARRRVTPVPRPGCVTVTIVMLLKIPTTDLRRRGFSLMEMVIVVLIISIMAAVAVPRYGDASARFQADAAARRIKADLEFLRQQARKASASRAIVFDLANHRYTLSGVADLDRSSRTYTVHLTRFPYDARLVSVACGGDSTLAFNGFGLPDSGGTIVVAAGPHQRSISVDGSTGKVDLP